MTLKDIAILRLKNQLLLGTELNSPQQIVEWMGAMQAQHYDMAKWAVGVRLLNTTDQQIEDALNNGYLIRTHIPRHLQAYQDIDGMRFSEHQTARPRTLLRTPTG